MHKLYEKRNKTQICYLVVGNQISNEFLQKDTSILFTILPHIFLEFLVRAVGVFTRRDTYLESNFEIYQTIRSFVFWKGMSRSKIKYFEESIERYVELGFGEKFDRSGELPKISAIKFEPRGDFKHYSSMIDYVEDNTRVEALSFDKLNYLFRIYFVLLVVILFVNFVHYCFVRIGIRRIIRRSRRRIGRKLKAFSRNLYSFLKRKLNNLFS